MSAVSAFTRLRTYVTKSHSVTPASPATAARPASPSSSAAVKAPCFSAGLSMLTSLPLLLASTTTPAFALVTARTSSSLVAALPLWQASRNTSTYLLFAESCASRCTTSRQARAVRATACRSTSWVAK